MKHVYLPITLFIWLFCSKAPLSQFDRIVVYFVSCLELHWLYSTNKLFIYFQVAIAVWTETRELDSFRNLRTRKFALFAHRGNIGIWNVFRDCITIPCKPIQSVYVYAPLRIGFMRLLGQNSGLTAIV